MNRSSFQRNLRVHPQVSASESVLNLRLKILDFIPLGLLVLVFLPCALTQAEDKPVSYYGDLVPVFKRSCTGCHHPGKLKGQLDLTS